MTRLEQICKIEPKLVALWNSLPERFSKPYTHEEAGCVDPFECRWSRFKPLLEELVGYSAERPQLRNALDYETAIVAVRDRAEEIAHEKLFSKSLDNRPLSESD